MGCIQRWSLLVLIAAGGVSAGQDPRLEPPQTPAEWWRAVTFEINTGKYDAAAYYLRGFVASNPSDEDLVALEGRDGIAAFLRLRNVPRWSPDAKANDEAKKNAEDVITRVSAAVDKQLGSQDRISRFVTNLRGSPDERSYAVRELQRSGARAVPALVAALAADADPAARIPLLDVLPALPEEAVTPLLAALDMRDTVLKYQLLKSLGNRADFATLAGRTETNPLPTLDYLAASPAESDSVRRLARELITRIRPVARSEVRPAKWELTEAAQRMYRHQERFVKPAAVPVWRWVDDGLVLTPSTAAQAEEYYGLRYARWALELDPEYLPAQVAFLSLAADKALERIGRDADLAKAEPAVHALLAESGSAALIAALDQALAEGNANVALGMTRVLAERDDVRAAQPDRNRPGVLQRALDFPDRRVQFAAAEALVRLPGPAVQTSQVKVVETLRRALASESEVALPAKSRAVVGHFDIQRGQELERTLQAAGFETVLLRTGREVMRRLRVAGDIDLVVLDSEIPFPPLPDMLANLHYDVHLSSLPVRVVYAPRDPATFAATGMERTLGRTTPQTVAVRRDELYQEDRAAGRLRRLTENMRHVVLLTAPVTPELIKASYVRDTGPAEAPLTPAQRKQNAARAIELFRVLASTQPGVDLQPASRAIRMAMNEPELAKTAIEVVGRLPGRDAQIDLATVVLDPNRPADLRALAADQLIAHFQRFNMVLPANQIAALLKLNTTVTDPGLRAQVSRVVGTLSDSSATSGQRMRRYVPPVPGTSPKAEQPVEPKAEPKKDNPPDDM
jgi:hypothetical protein